MKKRSVFLGFILTFLTLGIYGIYWFVVLTNETKEATDDKSAGGGLAIFLSIITFGIYSLFWAYAMGRKIEKIAKKSSRSVLYLILALFLSPFIVMMAAQGSVNRAIKNRAKANPNKKK